MDARHTYGDFAGRRSYAESMAFKDNLARLMDQQGLNHEQLATKLGISRPAVSQWLDGTTHPKGARLAELATALDASVQALFANDALGNETTATVEQSAVIGHKRPAVGDPIQDLNEAALINLWRSLSFIKRAAMLERLSFTDIPDIEAARRIP